MPISSGLDSRNIFLVSVSYKLIIKASPSPLSVSVGGGLIFRDLRDSPKDKSVSVGEGLVLRNVNRLLFDWEKRINFTSICREKVIYLLFIDIFLHFIDKSMIFSIMNNNNIFKERSMSKLRMQLR